MGRRPTTRGTLRGGIRLTPTGPGGVLTPAPGTFIPLPLNFDHTRNIFEATRKGTPVVRGEDMLACRIELRGLTVKPGRPPMLSRTGGGTAYLILHLPPQAIGEEVFFEAAQPEFSGGEDLPPGVAAKPTPPGSEIPRALPHRARAAGESRLAFRVPDGFSCPWTLEGVLAALETLPPSVAPNALPRSKKRPPILKIRDLFRTADIAKLAPAQRVALSRLAATTLRLGGDTATLRLRQAGGGLALRPVDVIAPGVVVGARPRPVKPGDPSATQTALEVPWRMILSPHSGTRWRHSAAPATSLATHHTELWHSRLVAPKPDGSEPEPSYPDPDRTLRAIWARSGSGTERMIPELTPDWPNSAALPSTASLIPFRMALDNNDRTQIVHLSSNFQLTSYTPEPLDTKAMIVTALGAWLDSRGAWVPEGLSVEEWVNRTTLGRDHYVRVVYKGYLFPFGHRVSLVKVTERKFHSGVTTDTAMPGNAAILRQRMFIVVREPLRSYDGGLAAKAADGTVFSRQFPFTQVEILTERTPDLDPPETGPGAIPGMGREMFWPYVGNQPFAFDCVGTDLDGNRIAFELPMIFMDNTRACPRKLNAAGTKLLPDFPAAESNARTAADAFAAASDRNTAQMGRQRVAMAPSLRTGDTAVKVQEMRFGGTKPEPGGNLSLQQQSEGLTRPLFLPLVTGTLAEIEQVSGLTGGGGGTDLSWNAFYLKNGFNQTAAANPGPTENRGEVFLDVSGGPNLDFSAQGDRSGGFMQPNLKPAALSRLAGPVMGDVAKFIKGQTDPGGGFPSDAGPGLGDLPLPLLFGCIPLGAVIEAVASLAGNEEKIPKFVNEAGNAVEALVDGLARLYALISEMPGAHGGIAKAGVAAFDATLDDLRNQAEGLVAARRALVQGKIDTVRSALTDVVTALSAIATATIDDAPALPAVGALAGHITTARNALAQLKTEANAAPGGVSLPAGLKVSLLTAIDKLDAFLADLGNLAALLTAGRNTFQALDAIVGDPGGLEDLLTDAGALETAILNLQATLPPLSTAIDDFRLIEGAPEKAILKALDVVEDALGVAADIAKIVEMLTGDELTLRFDWRPEIGSFPKADPIFRANDKRGLYVGVEAKVKKRGGGNPSISVLCGLKHFDLVLIGAAAFIELNFEKIEFSIDSGAKPDVDVMLSDIKFVGPLSFVETLKDLIPLDGFSDPPYLDVTPQGINAGFDVALPGITCGVLNIQNISLGAHFTVPFIGQPLSVGFNFCTREQPFLLTVYVFGGGGFFGITIDPNGVQILEAAFEFGAAFSVDFGVASGGVEVMAGIYFRMEQSDASLTGYFRMGGRVSVLGLISASIELYLELRYEFESGKCVGKAQLTIEVEVLFFSASVTITCERKFAGSNGDPTFRQMLGHAPEETLEVELAGIDETTEYGWRDWCEAFA